MLKNSPFTQGSNMQIALFEYLLMLMKASGIWENSIKNRGIIRLLVTSKAAPHEYVIRTGQPYR